MQQGNCKYMGYVAQVNNPKQIQSITQHIHTWNTTAPTLKIQMTSCGL